MLQGIFVIVTGLLALWRFIRGVGGGSSSSKAMIYFVVGSAILKFLDFLALGFVTYKVSGAFVDYGIGLVQDYINSLGGYSFSALLFDLLNTMMFPQVISIVFSAITIAMTIQGTKWAMKFNGFFTPN